MVEHGNSTFIYVLIKCASYDLWHARPDHVNYSVISFLNKKCHLSLTSLLPSPSLCSTYQLAKSPCVRSYSL